MTAIIKGESPEHLRVYDPRGAAGGWFVLKDRDATRSLSERNDGFNSKYRDATQPTGSSLRRHVRYVMMMFITTCLC